MKLITVDPIDLAPGDSMTVGLTLTLNNDHDEDVKVVGVEWRPVYAELPWQRPTEGGTVSEPPAIKEGT